MECIIALSKQLTTVTTFSKIVALFLFILFPFLGFVLGMQYQALLSNSPIAPIISPDKGVACTMDAKMCPDGSAVGRIPPSCEFEECPQVSTNPTEAETAVEKIIDTFKPTK